MPFHQVHESHSRPPGTPASPSTTKDLLTTRRYAGNEDAWTFHPSESQKNRTKSTRSKTMSKFSLISSMRDVADEMGGQNAVQLSCYDSMLEMFERWKIQAEAFVIDQWRRATQSGVDPFVVIAIKPTPDGTGKWTL